MTNRMQAIAVRHLPRGVAAIAVMAAALTGTTATAELNVNPGLWEFTSNMRMEGPMEMPDQQSTETDCLTQEEIDEDLLFGLDEDDAECEVVDSDITSDRVAYTLMCDYGDGDSFESSYVMHLMGDRVEGEMVGDIDTPMGEMKMFVDFEGEKIGDSC